MKPLFLSCLLAALCVPCPAAPSAENVQDALKREAAESADNDPKRAQAYKNLVAALDKIAVGQPADAPNKAGNTPLMLAVRLDRLDAAEWLLKRGANPLLNNKAGKCALDMAENDRMRQLLNDNKPITSIEEAVAFMKAREKEINPDFGYLEWQNALKKWQCEGGVPPGFLLYAAVATGHHALAAFLIAQGANPDSLHWEVPLLSRAVMDKRRDLVDLLLNAGADINIENTHDGSPLTHAADDESMLQYLLERGASIPSFYSSAVGCNIFLPSLLRAESPKPLAYILSKISTRPSDISIFRVARDASLPVYRWLAEHGFDPRKRDKDGCSLLTYCGFTQDKSLLIYILDSLSPTARELEQELLRLDTIGAINNCSGSWDNLELLLKRGVNVNSRDGRGRTFLHYAAENTWPISVESVEWLLQHGADPSIKDKEGKRPIDLVREASRHPTNKQKIIDLLSAGKRPAHK